MSSRARVLGIVTVLVVSSSFVMARGRNAGNDKAKENTKQGASQSVLPNGPSAPDAVQDNGAPPAEDAIEQGKSTDSSKGCSGGGKGGGKGKGACARKRGGSNGGGGDTTASSGGTGRGKGGGRGK